MCEVLRFGPAVIYLEEDGGARCTLHRWNPGISARSSHVPSRGCASLTVKRET